MRVRDIMSTDVAFCHPDTSLPAVARMMVDMDCGEIPVVDASCVPIGVITDRDIACRAVAKGRDALALTAADCMTSPAVTVAPDATLEQCCELLEENRVRRVPVVDGEGVCCGMVSQADIARHAPKTETAEVVRTLSQPAPPPASRIVSQLPIL
jgi:CBS domain-containing protein